MPDINNYAPRGGKIIDSKSQEKNEADFLNVALEPFSGTANVTHVFAKPMNGFVISNDGAADLTFTIGGDTYTVRAEEVFEENFLPFTEVVITTTVPFRAYGRG